MNIKYKKENIQYSNKYLTIPREIIEKINKTKLKKSESINKIISKYYNPIKKKDNYKYVSSNNKITKYFYKIKMDDINKYFDKNIINQSEYDFLINLPYLIKHKNSIKIDNINDIEKFIAIKIKIRNSNRKLYHKYTIRHGFIMENELNTKNVIRNSCNSKLRKSFCIANNKDEKDKIKPSNDHDLYYDTKEKKYIWDINYEKCIVCNTNKKKPINSNFKDCYDNICDNCYESIYSILSSNISKVNKIKIYKYKNKSNLILTLFDKNEIKIISDIMDIHYNEISTIISDNLLKNNNIKFLDVLNLLYFINDKANIIDIINTKILNCNIKLKITCIFNIYQLIKISNKFNFDILNRFLLKNLYNIRVEYIFKKYINIWIKNSIDYKKLFTNLYNYYIFNILLLHIGYWKNKIYSLKYKDYKNKYYNLLNKKSINLYDIYKFNLCKYGFNLFLYNWKFNSTYSHLLFFKLNRIFSFFRFKAVIQSWRNKSKSYKINSIEFYISKNPKNIPIF